MDACGEKKSLSANCPRMSAFVRGSVRETRCPRCPQAKPIYNFKKKHWESEHLPLVRGETYGIRCPRDSVKTCLFPLVTQDLNNAIPMEKFGLRVLRGRVGVSDPEPSNLATEATEMEYKCVTYLDLPYGAYFCRCSKTVELSPFLRKNAVPENPPARWGVIFRMALVKGYRFTWGGGHFSANTSCF